MNEVEKFEEWRKQTLKQLNLIEKKIDMLYKTLVSHFDETVLALLWQTHLSYKQLKEVYEHGVCMFSVEKSFNNDNSEDK